MPCCYGTHPTYGWHRALELWNAHVTPRAGDMVRGYLSDRHLVPHGNLVEVAFDDLKTDPLRTAARIYKTLNLSVCIAL